jgi:hypothetical protein
MVRCIHFVSKLKVHIISNVATKKFSLILNFFKNRNKIDLGFKNKFNYINHEYEIDSELYLYVSVDQ